MQSSNFKNIFNGSKDKGKAMMKMMTIMVIMIFIIMIIMVMMIMVMTIFENDYLKNLDAVISSRFKRPVFRSKQAPCRQ
jgi:preprotein translocase subunit SecG